jgi:hypothetical protein
VRSGYANFAVDDPPLKLVLIEDSGSRGAGVVGALNHLGVEVTTADEVSQATTRLRAQGLETEEQLATNCCFALQDKVWVGDPDHTPWEIYTVLADAPAGSRRDGDATCCANTDVAAVSAGACC